MRIGKKAASVPPSATLAMAAKAKAMRKNGIDVISFSTGEPDFITPKRIMDKAVEAMQAGHTKYTPTPGIPELRETIVGKYEKDYQMSITPEQVVFSCGAKHSIYLSLLAILDEGEQVILPSPYWVSYPHQIRLAGGEPVVVETSSKTRFRLTPDALEAAITEKTRALILNSPSNPTGEVYTKAELAALAKVIEKHGLVVIADDIYERLIYEGEFASIIEVLEKPWENAIQINGVSKSSAMTGWRLGYLVADETVAKAVSRLQGQMTSHPASIAQYAGIEALGEEEVELPGWLEKFKARRDFIVDALNAIEGIHCEKPAGAFYVFPDFTALLGKKSKTGVIEDDFQMSEYLLETAHAATVPGGAFGAKGFIRFSFATSLDTIEEGMKRIAAAIGELD